MRKQSWIQGQCSVSGSVNSKSTLLLLQIPGIAEYHSQSLPVITDYRMTRPLYVETAQLLLAYVPCSCCEWHQHPFVRMVMCV
jgi:hypothetical protein